MNRPAPYHHLTSETFWSTKHQLTKFELLICAEPTVTRQGNWLVVMTQQCHASEVAALFQLLSGHPVFNVTFGFDQDLSARQPCQHPARLIFSEFHC